MAYIQSCHTPDTLPDQAQLGLQQMSQITSKASGLRALLCRTRGCLRHGPQRVMASLSADSLSGAAVGSGDSFFWCVWLCLLV
jgi:hypothetical protein